MTTRDHALAADTKPLVVFFSWDGNTRKVAEIIAKETGASLLELKTATPYPAGYSEVGAVAKKEWQENARPALSTRAPKDFASCSKIIFIGYPVWNHTMPMPVYTFLESYDFSGKVIVPFSSHMGDGLGDGPGKIAEKRVRDNAGLQKTFKLLLGLRHCYASWLPSSGKVTMCQKQLLTH